MPADRPLPISVVILTLNEAFSHPQATARGMRIRMTDHDIPGGIEVANAALKLSAAPVVGSPGAPIPGGDTEQVAAILQEDKSPLEAMRELMSRPGRVE